jgi:pimeloyl-ACP methyl ester carboxylesterase
VPIRTRLAPCLRRAALTGALVLGALAALPAGFASPQAGFAQELPEVQAPPAPLMLQRRGSFLVGGESVEQTPAQLSFFTGQLPPAGGHVTVDQMYVEYMVPAARTGVPVVLLHGATLTGKGYDTTPDGRMGWYEYFVRHGHPTYVPDQVSRGRSGFDLATYNEVRAGQRPPTDLPNIWRFADELVWTQFRFGPSAGTPFPDAQFPVEYARELSRQAVPDLNFTLPQPDPNVAATAGLAGQLGGAVLLGHSQSGLLPLAALLADPAGVKGLILVEPGSCRASQFTDAQIATLATVPILAVFGDHLDAVTGTAVSWRAAYDDCQALLARVAAAGGTAEMLHPPALGIYGNSHMLMQDKNNLQIADLILAWIGRAVGPGAA